MSPAAPTRYSKSVEIFVISSPARNMDIGLSSVHPQAREEVCITSANPLTVLQDELVRVQGVDPLLNPAEVIANLIEYSRA